jgi:predicted nucleic-acid-binding Zn-ribbon protein
MAHSRLHIICGNCGCKDMFEYKIHPEGHDITDNEGVKFKPAVFITCRNCATLHDLEDFIPLSTK